MVLAFHLAVRWRELLGEHFGTQGYAPVIQLEETALRFYFSMPQTSRGGAVSDAFAVPSETWAALHSATEHALEIERARREQLEQAIVAAVDNGDASELVHLRATILPLPEATPEPDAPTVDP
jgi:hypothetical protein